MAPAHDKAQLAKAVIVYMGYISEQDFSRQDKKMARSPELKKFLVYLSKRAPLVMDRLLKGVSRECGEALRAEKESRTGKKRAEPPKRTENNAKRIKFTCAAEQGPTRQIAVDDEEDVTIKDETPMPHCNPQPSEMARPQLSTSENNKESRGENAEKEASNTKPAQNESSSLAITSSNERQEGDIVIMPTAYEIESGLSSGSIPIEEYVRDFLFTLEPSMTRPNFNIHDEVAKIWKIILLLDFFKTRRELQQYLENREQMPGEKLQTRTNWKTTDPGEILDILENVKRNTIDNKIHRAYGQTMLFSSVNAQVATGYKSTVTGHRSDHAALLEELARKKAGPVSQPEIDQIIASYFYEYYAGRNWLAVIDWFGGSGVVLVFVIAGIGSWYVETRWTEFQRSCVQHIAGLLGSIRGLVGTLGPDALGNYCQHGCLGKQCLDRVKLAGFSKPDKDEESGDEEMGDEEMGDEETGDEETGNEETGDKEMGDEEVGDEEVGDEEVGDEEVGDEEVGDQAMGNEETGNEGSNTLDSYGQPGCLNNDCAAKIPLANSTKPADDEGVGDEEPGNEESEDEESGDEGTEYEDEESENSDEESEDEAEESEDDTG